MESETGKRLSTVSETLTIRQRKTISLPTIAKTVFTLYPKRTVLCLALFIGQAFLYNAFFFTYGDSLSTFFGVKQTGYYIAAFAASNFLGALLLGSLFDTVGRVKMIAGTYIVSGVLLGVAGFVLGDLNAMTLTIFGMVIFFFASAGASAAYLTASEVFPMETRALCIAFFYAVGTAIGGITGPLYFGKLIDNASAAKDITGIAPGYFLGAALMVAGGIVAIFLGVHAEGETLENIAKPLTAEDDAATGQADRRRSRPDGTAQQRGAAAMPMPPPKPSTEGRRDRQAFHEMGQIVRALEANGPRTPDELKAHVGATYWEERRFDAGAEPRGHGRSGLRAAGRAPCTRCRLSGQRPKIR